MNSLASQSVMQLVIWGISLIQLILALYVLILNARHPANRYTSALFLLFAVNSFALGLLSGAEGISEGTTPAILLAVTSPIAGIALLLTAIILIREDWVTGRRRWAWIILHVFAAIPIILTLIDILAGSHIWFVGLPESYAGGYAPLSDYTNPKLAILRIFLLVGIPILTILPLAYLSFFDKTLSTRKRRLARILLVAQFGATIAQMALASYLLPPVPTVLTNAIFFAVYAYASFSQAISERRLQRGRVQIRLTALVLTISIPLLIFTSAYMFSQTSSQIRRDSVERLDRTSQSVAAITESWLDLNIKALSQMNTTPGIISMNPTLQKPILESVDNTYPHMYLVSTTDNSGNNIARSDDNNLTDYSDRIWFQRAIEGAEVTFQTLIGRTSGEPALVVSEPIFSDNGEILGVGMFASDLNDLSEEVTAGSFGESGRIFIVDSDNQVVAHTNPEFANQLLNLSLHPAIVSMRNANQADRNGIRYTDENGTTWIAYFQNINYGWGVVAEQSEAEVLGALQNLQISTWVVITIGTLLLAVFSALAIRQSMQPIGSLTETATAIAAGDLSRVAPVESIDEFGFLAESFNRMTEQLLELIGNLEQRVSERTKDLEARSRQLEAAAEVGRSASSILDVNELMENTVDLIRERFNLYYVGLFLTDENWEFAVLQAGTGEAGQRMLARQHKIRIGEGMIGWTVANGQPRVALEVGEDAVRQATAELPETRSEAAIPLRSRGQVIGALTVQSVRSGEFDEAVIAVLQTMADLISVAIDNARLFTETETALQSTRRAYSELSHEDWMKLLQAKSELSFRSDQSGTNLVSDIWSPNMKQAWERNATVITNDSQPSTDARQIAIPIRVRGNVIGVLETQKSSDSGNWTEEERTMLETIIEQLGVALDSARLYEETQVKANNERMIGEISAHMRQTLNIETVLQTAARELRSALDLAEVEIRMGNAPSQNGSESSG